MPIVAKSDLSTGILTHASYLLRSGDLNLLFSAAYSPSISLSSPSPTASIPSFSAPACFAFSASHGLSVRAVAVEVDNAELAFTTSVNHGAVPSSPAVVLNNRVKLSEVRLFGDVVLRYISYNNPNQNQNLLFLPVDFGIRRLDHAVGNVPELSPALKYIKQFTGFHEFAEFISEDVGTKTYLEHSEGAGLQHVALMSEDIFKTLREMRKKSGVGGFEFMPSPPVTYYRNLINRSFGILVDRDDQGTLLQIFTKPIGDRPTIFLEIIQRVGCMLKDEEGKEYQKGGWGEFGKGNVSELFKSILEYEKTLETRRTA
ncbi:4-hydroxyphenylpyruvate dioxygenase [Medicago truncatula]|uniref:4-hydroxyphenylpyruvate dioxygenase n=1 Tax=Medicago truncatula TaxID=3880 RepID=G7K3B7_MEDTR|nr:4-hydroxyphenylpyruvate dioxygenase [Medicago truncatula]